MSRSPADVQQELLAVSPGGLFDLNSTDTYLAGRFLGPANELSLIEASMEALLPQVDIRVAYNLLPDYQRVLGPDPCGDDQALLPFEEQAANAFARWTAGGDMCAGTLIALAASVGVAATIIEAVCWECGVASCDEEMVPGYQNFAFIVTLPSPTFETNWECGVATCDDSLGIFAASPAVCPITTQAPLHTQPCFSYEGA